MPFLSSEILRDVIASRPAAGSGGRIFFSSDEGKTYRDNGSTWDEVSDAGVVTSVAGQTGAVVLAESDITGLVSDLAAKAPLASPTFTGTPAAPTPLTADSSTKLATTAYVQAQGFGTGSGTVTHTAGALTSGLPVLGNGAADVIIGTKTGSGDVVFATSPTLVTPALGTPSALVLTNATALPGGQITGANSIPASTLPLATTGAFGAVKPDGSSITISAGVISAAGGAVPNFADKETPSGTVDGSNQVFTLAHAPNPTASLIFTRQGVVQIDGTDFTISGGTITYSGSLAPASGDLQRAWYRY